MSTDRSAGAVSSEMFPFAPHPDYQYSLDYAEKELKEAGDTAKRLGVRLTTHPGQVRLPYFPLPLLGTDAPRSSCSLRNSEGAFISLPPPFFPHTGPLSSSFSRSPRRQVVENAYRDLEYHNEMMERMGLDKDSVIIIHGGGVYGDKESAMARFKENYKELSQGVKNRFVSSSFLIVKLKSNSADATSSRTDSCSRMTRSATTSTTSYPSAKSSTSRSSSVRPPSSLPPLPPLT